MVGLRRGSPAGHCHRHAMALCSQPLLSNLVLQQACSLPFPFAGAIGDGWAGDKLAGERGWRVRAECAGAAAWR